MSGLSPSLLLQGYAAGIFPMADSRDADELFWVEPRARAILPLEQFHLSRSLRRTLRSGRFEVTLDRRFDEVVGACADRPETWISREIENAMLALHRAGNAHSVEVVAEGELVGGLYGVKLGRAFFGESMFSRATDASKVALAWLVARLKLGGYLLLDCQFMTDHLASLGATVVPRSTYVALLTVAVAGAAGSGSIGGSVEEDGGAAGGGARRPAALPPVAFDALDRWLEGAGAADSPAAAGQLIAQLLGQTS